MTTEQLHYIVDRGLQDVALLTDSGDLGPEMMPVIFDLSYSYALATVQANGCPFDHGVHVQTITRDSVRERAKEIGDKEMMETADHPYGMVIVGDSQVFIVLHGMPQHLEEARLRPRLPQAVSVTDQGVLVRVPLIGGVPVIGGVKVRP